MPYPVEEAVTEYIHKEARLGGYETAEKYRDNIESTYSNIASLINAEPKEIALLENATAAWNMAFYSVPFQDGDRILTSQAEYASNFINFLHLQKTRGLDLSVEVIPSDEHGQTSPEALDAMMDDRVRLVAITHVPTNGGLVNPVEKIGDVLNKDYDCIYLVDACQSVGQYPLNVKRIGCDLLSATGRKYLRGPRGTGFLYVNSRALASLFPPFLDLHSAEWESPDAYEIRQDARRFENWESNYAGIVGLNEAVSYAMKLGIENIWNRIEYLGAHLRAQLAEVTGCTVQDIGEVKGGIVTFNMDGISAENVRSALAEKKINVSVTDRSSTLIDMEKRGLDSLVRASVHYYNTEEEIEKLRQALLQLNEK